jgi:hypothetical protein
MEFTSQARWRAVRLLATTLIVIAWGSGIALPRMAHAFGTPGTPGCGGSTNVPTYHNDSQRTGWNQDERTLTPANVTPALFGLIKKVSFDDQVDAQPLVVTNQTIKGHAGARAVIYVATESNTIYAIDGCSGEMLTSRNLGDPVQTPLGCNNNGPNVGITGTPTIDLTTRSLYVIAYETVCSSVGPVEECLPTYKLYKLNLSDLSDQVPPVVVAASHRVDDGTDFLFNATYQRQRPALLQANGNIYAGFGSFCDFEARRSRGWVLGWKAKDLSPLNLPHDHQFPSFLTNVLTTPDLTTGEKKVKAFDCNRPCFLSSIWMSGYGLAADPEEKNLFFTTGNSTPYTDTGVVGELNIAESAVKMSNGLVPQGRFTPGNAVNLDVHDLDFGSGGLLVLPNLQGTFPRLAVAAGKDGNMYILNRDSMEGSFLGGMPLPPVTPVSIDHCFCGPSFFVGADGTPRVVSSGGHQLQTWTVNTSNITLQHEASAFIDKSYQNAEGFFTSISSDGTRTGTAIIWAVGRPTGNDSDVALYAFDAKSLRQLWKGSAGNWPNGSKTSFPQWPTAGFMSRAANW